MDGQLGICRKQKTDPFLDACVNAALRSVYTNSDFDSVRCDSRIRHHTKIGLFLALIVILTQK
jgi:hypothetical protein